MSCPRLIFIRQISHNEYPLVVLGAVRLRSGLFNHSCRGYIPTYEGQNPIVVPCYSHEQKSPGLHPKIPQVFAISLYGSSPLSPRRSSQWEQVEFLAAGVGNLLKRSPRNWISKKKDLSMCFLNLSACFVQFWRWKNFGKNLILPRNIWRDWMEGTI